MSAMNKSLVGWEVIGDDVLPTYVGIFFAVTRIRSLNNLNFLESKAVFVFPSSCLGGGNSNIFYVHPYLGMMIPFD